MSDLSIAVAATECVPFVKTGGMGDVVSSINCELKKLRNDLIMFLPFYKVIQEGNYEITNLQMRTTIRISGYYKEASFFSVRHPKSGIEVILVKCDDFFYRGNLYSENNYDYPDNLDRYILFSKAILNYILMSEIHIDVIHCHDWQTALIPLYLKLLYMDDPGMKNIKSLFTIHNFGYQGIFNINEFHKLNISWEYFTTDRMEYFNKINLLKSAISFSDSVSTVSEKYRDELLLDSKISEGMLQHLQSKKEKFFGILNGVDYNIWSPMKDKNLKQKYSIKDLTGKQECKLDLLKIACLKNESYPLIVMITRLVNMKGFDILLPALEAILKKKVNFIILGLGDELIMKELKEIEARYKNFKLFFDFDEVLAHKIEAGADMLLMPSNSEPCGLNQLYSLKYGTVPIVYNTGGLADTIQDYNKENVKNNTATGFIFYEYSSEALKKRIDDAIKLFKKPEKWQKLVKKGMEQDFSWKMSSKKYMALYNTLINN